MLSELFKMPSEILVPQVWFYVLSQVVGLCGTVLLLLSYQVNKRTGIITVQFFAAMFFAAQFIMLGAYTGAVMNILSSVRGLVFYFKDTKKWASSPVWLIIFTAAFIVSGILTWNNIFSLLPIIAMTLANIALWIKDPQKIRFIMFPTSPLWLTYNAVNGSLIGVITEIFTMTSLLIAMVRFDFIPWIKGRKEAK